MTPTTSRRICALCVGFFGVLIALSLLVALMDECGEGRPVTRNAILETLAVIVPFVDDAELAEIMKFSNLEIRLPELLMLNAEF